MASSRRIPSPTLKRTIIVRSNLDATILTQAEPQHILLTSALPSIDTCIFAWTPSTDTPVIIKGIEQSSYDEGYGRGAGGRKTFSNTIQNSLIFHRAG